MPSTSHLSLEFALREGLTRLKIACQEPPWRVVRAFPNAQQEALVHLHNLSGGLLAGDDLSSRIHLAAGAQTQITSSGATRIYKRGTSGKRACQRTVIQIESGALLEFVPDQIIPFAGSSYWQETEVHLEGDGAGVFWWETLTGGRTAANEHFAWETLSMRSSIFAKRNPIALERSCIEPALSDVQSKMRMGPFTCAATFFICRTALSPTVWELLDSRLSELAETLIGITQWGVSRLVSDGIVVRGLGENYSDIHGGLLRFWQEAKLFLYGRQAIPPRKVY